MVHQGPDTLARHQAQHGAELLVGAHGGAAQVDLLEEDPRQLELLGRAAGGAVGDDAAARRDGVEQRAEVRPSRAVDDQGGRSAGLLDQLLLPSLLLVRNRGDGPHASRALELLLAAAGDRDLRTERLRELHGHGSHTAADAGDQHVISALHFTAGDQGPVGGDPRQGQRGSLGPAEVLRHRLQAVERQGDSLREGALLGHAADEKGLQVLGARVGSPALGRVHHHLAAHPGRIHARTDRLDHASPVGAEDGGELDFRVEAHPDELVAVVQGGGLQPHHGAARRGDRVRNLVDLELLTDLVQADCAHDHLIQAAARRPRVSR